MHTPLTETRFLILGAGPTGLGAATELSQCGERDFLVLEREGHAGGLASSFVDDDGFTWDIGGHVHFSHYPYYNTAFERALGEDGWHTLARNASVWMRERFIPYPLQENIGRLPLSLGLHALIDMLRVRAGRNGETPGHFYAWMQQTFGHTLTEAFMRPYNEKVWAHHPRLMATEWLGDRVAIPELRTLIINFILRREASGWGPNKTFRFPKTGGTGALWQNVARPLREHIHFGEEVVSIDTCERIVTTQSGNTYRYEHLMTTMPLRTLVEQVVMEVPDDIRRTTSKLSYSSSHIVGIGLRGVPGAELSKQSWMYFPEANTPFYRATVFSSYSESHVPRPDEMWSLMLETSESSHRPVARSRIVTDTIQGCLATGLIETEMDIISTWQYTAPFGYPVPTVERDDALNALLPYLSSLNIDSRGRFGGWKYEVGNQDHSFMQGVEWVRAKLYGEEEITLSNPKKVNGR